MASKQHHSSEMVSIPSEPVLRQRLQRVKAESRRLSLLIRTAREMARIEESLGEPGADERREVPCGK